MAASYRAAQLCFLLSSFVVAQTAASPVKTDEQPAETLLILQMGACERQCPVYRIILFSDGSGIFEGRYLVRRPGLLRLKTSREQLGKLMLEASSLYDLPGRFAPNEQTSGGGACESPQSDAPTAILTIGTRSRTKTILHYRGCVGADADRLKQFEDRIIATSGAAKSIR